jgi:hypothetical protein
MTPKEAKKELAPLKDMAKDIKSVEDEIERLITIATKMTTSFDPVNIVGAPKNKMEDALMKLEDYRLRLSNLLMEDIAYKNRCLDIVYRIEPKSLQKILLYYYFQDNTMEKTAELIGKSYQWTYELYKSALKKYAEISST